MTATATPASARPLWHRLVSAGVVILGGVFWIGGAFLFTVLGRRWSEMYERFEIKGGLPYPTQLVMDLYALLSHHWAGTCLIWAVLVAGLALAASWSQSRRAFRLAGWFAVACFFGWYSMLIVLPVTLFLPLVRCA